MGRIALVLAVMGAMSIGGCTLDEINSLNEAMYGPGGQDAYYARQRAIERQRREIQQRAIWQLQSDRAPVTSDTPTIERTATCPLADDAPVMCM